MNDLLLESCYYELGDCISDYEEQSVFEAKLSDMFTIDLTECNSVTSLQEGFKEIAQKIATAVTALITKIKAFIDRLRAKAAIKAFTGLEENALKLKEKAKKENLGSKKLEEDIIVFSGVNKAVEIGKDIGKELAEIAESFGDKIYEPFLAKKIYDDELGVLVDDRDFITRASDEFSKTASSVKDNLPDIKPKIEAIFKKYNITKEGYTNAIEAIAENDTSKFDKSAQLFADKLSTVDDVIKYYDRAVKPGVNRAINNTFIDTLTKAKKGLEKTLNFIKKKTGLINGTEARAIITAGNMVYSHIMKTIMIDVKSFKRANIAMSKAISGKSSNNNEGSNNSDSKESEK